MQRRGAEERFADDEEEVEEQDADMFSGVRMYGGGTSR